MAASRLSILWLLLRRFALRHWRLAPGQSLMLVAILALGVAVFLSIRLANRAVMASFQNFTDLVTQESDLLISAPSGSLPQEVLLELRQRLQGAPVHLVPVVESTAAPPRQSENETIGSRPTYNLLGLDLIGIQNLAREQKERPNWFGQRSSEAAAEGGSFFWRVMRDSRLVFISEELAQREGLKPGDTWQLIIQEKLVDVEIAGVIPTSQAVRAPANLIILDLPALQALTGRIGSLDRVEFLVEEGPGAQAWRAQLPELLREWGGDRWKVSTPSDRREAAAVMTRAFRMNLTILSLIALLVGMYLIFAALDGAVVRRREEIAILRSLGVEERWIQKAWLWEATMLGLLGGLLGLMGGWLGAQFAVRIVGRTVNALYYSTSAQSAALEPTESILALLIAVMASLVAGWFPARLAASTPPAQVMGRHSLASPPPRWMKRAWLGLIVVLVGWSLIKLPPLRLEGGIRFPLAGYAAAFLWIFGMGLLGGRILSTLAGWLRPLGRWQATLRLALSHLTLPSSRHLLAVAGLVCAVSMTSGMAILVASFDTTMRGWIERTFQSDLYISSDGAQSASTQNRISTNTWKQVVAHPQVRDAQIIQATELSLPTGPTVLVGAELGFMQRHVKFAWRQEPRDDTVFDPARNRNLALVSESFADRYRVEQGSTVQFTTPAGPQTVTITGVFSDYGNERGSLLVNRAQYLEWYRDEAVTSIILVLKEGVDPEVVRTELRQQFPGLIVLTNQSLRQEVMRIFQQTFSITYALELIGVVVAMVGLGLMLASALLQRRTELTTLRALGFRHREIAQATAWEGVWVATSGLIAGLLTSLALGWLLVYVINKQTFGWTLGFTVPWTQLLLLSLLVISSAAAVGYGVGRWGADLPADREE